MKTKTKLTLACTAFACALMLATSFELAAQKNKSKKDDGKIHLKIVEEQNGVSTIIDTTFDAKDKEAMENFMQQHNMTGTVDIKGNDTKVYMYKFDDREKEISEEYRQQIQKEMEELKSMSNEDKAKMEHDMEKLQNELGKMKELHFNFDSLPDGSFKFEMNLPDEKEMQELENKMREMHLEIPAMPDMPDMSPMPPMMDFNFNTDGMSEQDKKQFDEHMKKAKEEMQKAFELMKDSTGNMKLRFNFDSDDAKDGGYNMHDKDGDFLFGFPPSAVALYNISGNDNGKKCCVIVSTDDSMPTNCMSRVVCTADKNKVDRKIVVITKSKTVKGSKTVKEKSVVKDPTQTEKTSAPKSIEAFADLTCYPNPNSGLFDVKFSTPTNGNLELKIVDASGKEIVNENYENFSGTFNKQFDISKQGKGIYMLMIKQGADWSHKKIVVK